MELVLTGFGVIELVFTGSGDWVELVLAGFGVSELVFTGSGIGLNWF